MDEDDDVERLFSWLQTPELRYREFAGAREITDSVVTWQARTNTLPPADTAAENVQLEEEYPPNQFPDQSGVVGPAVRGSAPAAPTPAARPVTAPTQVPGGPFGLGASGRGIPRYPEYAEPVIQQPVAPQPGQPVPPQPASVAPRPVVPPTPVSPPPMPPRPAAVAQPSASASPPLPAPPRPAGGGLLGGAYRENGDSSEPAPVSPETQQRDERSLDAVFGRLAGGRNRLPDPRDRLRHIPGLGPPAGRPR